MSTARRIVEKFAVEQQYNIRFTYNTAAAGCEGIRIGTNQNRMIKFKNYEE
jgi:hypothetical protein